MPWTVGVRAVRRAVSGTQTLLVGKALATHVARPITVPGAVTFDTWRFISYDNELTSTELINRVADTTSIVVIKGAHRADKAAQLRARRPDIRIFDYEETAALTAAERTEVETACPGGVAGTKAMARTCADAYIQPENILTKYLMNVENACARDWQSSRLASTNVANDCDGQVFDTCPAHLNASFYTGTNCNSTDTTWRNGNIATYDETRTKLGGKLCIANMDPLKNGVQYRDEPGGDEALAHPAFVAGIFMESAFHGPNAGPTSFRPENEWQLDVELIQMLNADNRYTMVFVKHPGAVPYTQAEDERKRDFYLGSFLLSANPGISSWCYESGDPNFLIAPSDNGWIGALGPPTGVMQGTTGQIRYRRYQEGTVYVNPTSGSLNFEGQTLGANTATIALGADTTPPTVPAGLELLSATSTSVRIAWDPSTDNVAVSLYEIKLDGVSLGVVGSGAYTATILPGLDPSTTYSVTISARDAADNRSLFSTALVAATAAPPGDVTAPSTPTGLAASSITQTTAILTWTASTDNVAVTGYDIERDAVLVQTASATGHTGTQVTGLTASNSYSFRVKAFDAATNRSAASSAVVVNTLAAPSGVFTVAMGGDIAGPQLTTNDGTYHNNQTSDIIVADASIDAVFALGDNAYEAGRLSEYNGQYNQSWGRFKAKTYPIPGNHEWNSNNLPANYVAYYGSAKASPMGNQRYYYAVDMGGWHVMFLDSDIQHRGTSAAGAQLTWMDTTLAAWNNDGVPVLCAMHHNRFSNGGTGSHGANGNMVAFYTRLLTAKCDIIVHGHNHYADFSPRVNSSGALSSTGYRVLCVGSGGHPPDGLGTINTPTDFRTQFHGVLKLHLSASSYSGQYYRDNGDLLHTIPTTTTLK